MAQVKRLPGCFEFAYLLIAITSTRLMHLNQILVYTFLEAFQSLTLLQGKLFSVDWPFNASLLNRHWYQGRGLFSEK